MEYRGKQYSVILTIGGKWKWSAEIEGQYRSGMVVSRPAGVKLAERGSTRRWRRKRNACSVQNERGRQLRRGIMTNSRVAVLLLAVLALAIAGLMVETYWDCRLLKGGTLKKCMPGSGPRLPTVGTTNPTLR
jgi:hypothetical protein